jgi:hypothetical protein
MTCNSLLGWIIIVRSSKNSRVTKTSLPWYSTCYSNYFILRSSFSFF